MYHFLAWSVVVFILFLLSVIDSSERELSFTESTFVFSSSLLYFNFVWLIHNNELSERKHFNILLTLAILIGVVGYFFSDLWFSIFTLGALSYTWLFGDRLPVLVIVAAVVSQFA